MSATTGKFFIFRLTFSSYMEGLNDKVSDDEKILAAKQLLACIDVNMTFPDGKSIPVEADPPNRLDDGKIVYTRISRESLETLNAKSTHKEEKVKNYPYFNVVFDFRHPTDYILVAIEHKSKAFANIDFVRQGLERYFKQSIRDYDVNLRSASLSHRFWRRIEQKCAGNAAQLKSLSVEIPDVNSAFPLDVNDEEQAFLSSFLLMIRGAGGDDAHFGFGAKDDGKCLEVGRVKENWGRVVRLACQNGYVIKARLDNGMEVSSAVDAPAVYEMDKRMVGDGNEEADEQKMTLQEQKRRLEEWFDKIYTELKDIEKEEQQNGKNKRHIKK